MQALNLVYTPTVTLENAETWLTVKDLREDRHYGFFLTEKPELS